jgi:2-polyprenyl-6-methoxyphenol hydroxylase-like FAD-dependent oxidoreductase
VSSRAWWAWLLLSGGHADPAAAGSRVPAISPHALVEALAPESLRLGETLASLEQDEEHVTLHFFADGSAHSGALLVGADGLRSTVRAELLGDDPPRDSGLVAHRGVVAFDEPCLAGELWGPDGVFGLVPLSSSRLYWYATQREGDTRELLEAFGDWASPVPEVLAKAQDVLRHPLYDRPPARRWTEGRVALLGDAAHPMLPFLGQGACQAIEDAVAMGSAIAEHGAVPEALRAYERARRKRAAMLVRRSRTAGRVAHLRSAWQRGVRDALLRHTPDRARYRQLDAAIGTH